MIIKSNWFVLMMTLKRISSFLFGNYMPNIFFLSLSLSPWFIVSLRVRLWVCACTCAEVHSNRAIDFICVNFQFDMLDFSPNYYDYNLIHIYRALYLSVWPLGYLIGIRLQWEPESNNYIVLRVYSFGKISLSGSSLRCEKKQ